MSYQPLVSALAFPPVPRSNRDASVTPRSTPISPDRAAHGILRFAPESDIYITLSYQLARQVWRRLDSQVRTGLVNHQVRALNRVGATETSATSDLPAHRLTAAPATLPVLSSWFIHVNLIIGNILVIPVVGMYGTQIMAVIRPRGSQAPRLGSSYGLSSLTEKGP